MFLAESLSLAIPLTVVQHRILAFLNIGNLETVATTAYSESATVLTRVGIGGLAKEIAVQSIPAYQRGTVTVVPMRWLATGPLGSAFPVLDANIEMTAPEDGHTDLELVGIYRPPLGAVGHAIDRLVLHSMARSTIRSFLSHLGQVAEPIAPAPVQGGETVGLPEAKDASVPPWPQS